MVIENDTQLRKDSCGSFEEISDGSIAVIELTATYSGICHGIALWTDISHEYANNVGRHDIMPLVESGAPSVARPDQRQGLRLLETPQEVEVGAGCLYEARCSKSAIRRLYIWHGAGNDSPCVHFQVYIAQISC